MRARDWNGNHDCIHSQLYTSVSDGKGFPWSVTGTETHYNFTKQEFVKSSLGISTGKKYFEARSGGKTAPFSGDLQIDHIRCFQIWQILFLRTDERKKPVLNTFRISLITTNNTNSNDKAIRFENLFHFPRLEVLDNTICLEQRCFVFIHDFIGRRCINFL